MANEQITFDKLPQAVGYLTEQMEQIRLTNEVKSSTSMKMSCYNGLSPGASRCKPCPFRNRLQKVQTAVSRKQLSELQILTQRFTMAEGIDIAESYGMKEYAFKMFLKHHIRTLFRKENHGEYSK